MATTAHIIRSHYDPADREKLERETGQIHDDDPWQTESSFSAQRRIRSAPAFVPAVVPYNEWGLPSQLPSTQAEPRQPSLEVAEWYKSLTASTPSVIPSLYMTPRELPSRPSSALDSAELTKEKPFSEPITKNNWFITRALRSEPSSKPSSPVPSVADMLARDPPPLPSEQRFTPPVWLAIGPSNKGFSMLQRSGWNEGEGLGAHATRRPIVEGGLLKVKREEQASQGRRREVERATEIIDLTQSGSESESDDDFGTYQVAPEIPQQSREDVSEASLQKSLLTPLPTILKSDRLGIGLKAKTEGPYKQSKKRVTHNAAAMAAHIRASEKMRERRKETGRGRRGFAKVHEREENKRKRMLAYLND